MANSILEIRGIRQSFRRGFWLKNVEVLHGIDLCVPEKSIFGFLGPNGAGKTTLIQLIVGLRKPTAGEILISGVSTLNPLSRMKLGYLPERPYFHDHLTGEELLIYFGTLAGMKKKSILSRIPKVLKVVGMAHARNLELRRYSKGMLQRIGLAQAMIHDPELLVLDEPMSGLDPVGRKEIRELIVELASGGRTVFFSSHVIPDIEAICDRVAIIKKGDLVSSGEIKSYLEKEELGFEIQCSGVSPEKFSEFAKNVKSLRETPDGILAVIDTYSGVQEVMSRLIAEKIRILSMSPIRPSLEEFFYDAGK